MSKDKFQDKYNEIFQDQKNEKMNWDFEDFLQKVEPNSESKEKEIPVIPITQQSKPRIPKTFWMAASVVILVGIFFGIQKSMSGTIEDTDHTIANEIQKQKNDFSEENSMAVHTINDSIKNIAVDSVASDSVVSQDIAEADVLDKIVSKKSRLKKVNKERYTYNEVPASTPNKQTKPQYQDNFVIINGHRIENEEEAINVAKYSFQMLSEKMNKTFASTVVQESPAE